MSPEKILLDLLESINAAKAHYQIWWVISNEARPNLVPAMNQFSDFFIATLDAHFNSMILNLTYLFDKNHYSSTLQNYLNIDKASFHSDELKILNDKVESLSLAAEPIRKMIRNKAVAHKDAKLSEKEIFQNADITPNQIRDLIFSCASLIDDLRQRKGCLNGVFQSQRFAKSTLNAIKCLDNYRKLTINSGHSTKEEYVP